MGFFKALLWLGLCTAAMSMSIEDEVVMQMIVAAEQDATGSRVIDDVVNVEHFSGHVSKYDLAGSHISENDVTDKFGGNLISKEDIIDDLGVSLSSKDDVTDELGVSLSSKDDVTDELGVSLSSKDDVTDELGVSLSSKDDVTDELGVSLSSKDDVTDELGVSLSSKDDVTDDLSGSLPAEDDVTDGEDGTNCWCPSHWCSCDFKKDIYRVQIGIEFNELRRINESIVVNFRLDITADDEIMVNGSNTQYTKKFVIPVNQLTWCNMTYQDLPFCYKFTVYDACDECDKLPGFVEQIEPDKKYIGDFLLPLSA